ncbi:sigma-70 family RNA polymerase sigma factor [Phormidium tenue]|uniref:RNA polymerase subunit sigma n=1 Tax=Phormidium tenue NIES-30 TaxID=549789 RepID=A0A1U7J5W6_9CYAN|nr:sigma-70 family RNA polymerase sigma factor [Phormidium tenue]MBD2232416.1 sigma-70 family RNA polymerase sigma factor [Phormidium tenue FACHB-1052]OKH48093.1 RNA polymerase subunit sigma [Phormidium tenue NIES-30]
MSQSMFSTWPASISAPKAAVKPEQLTSTELVAFCQQRLRPERMMFAELLRRYQGHVDKLLYHLAPDWPDRADLAQEVWIRVYRNMRRLNDPAKFKGWLGRITTNLFYDELRRRKRNRATLSLDAPLALEDGSIDWDVPANAPGPVDTMMTQEFYDQLHRAIADLPEVFRTTIVLREIQGLSYEEIAEMTEVSLGTVKSRIARARQRLQTDLQPYLGN